MSQPDPSSPVLARLDRRGLLAAIGAFAIWGLLPLYLKLLHQAPVFQIMTHRVVWCCLFVFGWLGVRGELGHVTRALADGVTRLRLFASAVMITINWLTYVWAVGNGHVVEASLGYFINPLVSVLLGVLFLSEKLNPRQWIAVALAALGVAWLTWQVGRPPWIALTLAFSFGLYGFVRKTVVVDAVAGLAVETLLILPFALAWLLFEYGRGASVFGVVSWQLDALLVASGLLTAVPLVLFAFGVRRVPLTTIGLLQYMAPTLQLITALLVFKEPFTAVQAVGFGCIWLGLVVYAVDGVWRGRPAPALRVAANAGR
ncbi:chloramphenicol-sensitive protein RarD [Hydrocarboniphaga daqingensis]|jgi:chloramphenicol-sensitive protein RarD|uniref:Chloramphenicol-sensitive protein RarD n=1 Tax=Hydrocarboniphaga daqingensis TaxID=490188 RepID=A0A1M5MLY5_9GAMM|nr:EamA family transporter RarD [Hydrocarboniphaga daqingensis]SHG78281.1 chloramphenicol-sensitive protein RarD [Hydrocarboniphaga daqingensis]